MTGLSNPSQATVNYASGGYAGANGNDRQIAVGFKCDLVVVFTIGGVGAMWICKSPTWSAGITATCSVQKTDVLLHATDGFVVDQLNANLLGTDYFYEAFGSP